MIYRENANGDRSMVAMSSSRVAIALASFAGVALVAAVVVSVFIENANTIPSEAWAYLTAINLFAFGEKALAKRASS